MSTTIKTGWLNDKNGDKFAPRTLMSQVQNGNGELLEDTIQNTKARRISVTINPEDWVQSTTSIDGTNYTYYRYSNITADGLALNYAKKIELAYANIPTAVSCANKDFSIFTLCDPDLRIICFGGKPTNVCTFYLYVSDYVSVT